MKALLLQLVFSITFETPLPDLERNTVSVPFTSEVPWTVLAELKQNLIKAHAYDLAVESGVCPDRATGQFRINSIVFQLQKEAVTTAVD
jgi:hypothetical protein